MMTAHLGTCPSDRSRSAVRVNPWPRRILRCSAPSQILGAVVETRTGIEGRDMDDDESPITTLVAAAADGDEEAWNEIVSRYSPLLVSVIRRFRLSNSEVEDVAQTVWLRTVEQLAKLREPRALPQWIIVTARREALRQVTSGRRAQPRDPLDPVWLTNAATNVDPDERLIYAERHEALLAGLAELPERQREL